MNKTLMISALAVAGTAVLVMGGASLANEEVSTTPTQYGYQGTNVDSANYVDTDNDGVCDNYANRPQDGRGRGQGLANGQGNGQKMGNGQGRGRRWSQ